MPTIRVRLVQAEVHRVGGHVSCPVTRQQLGIQRVLGVGQRWRQTGFDEIEELVVRDAQQVTVVVERHEVQDIELAHAATTRCLIPRLRLPQTNLGRSRQTRASIITNTPMRRSPPTKVR